MYEPLGFLLRYGYWLTLGSVFAEQLGLPLPAVPILVGMGALSRSGEFSFLAVILIAVTGSLVADLIWYDLGRRHGRSILRLVCRISLEPDFCVRRTEDAFIRRGIWTLLFAKFVPGLNSAAVPLAGMIKVPLIKFLIFDIVGVVLWAGAYSTLGYVLSNQVERVITYLSNFGASLFVFAGTLIGLYVAYKYVQRRRYSNQLIVDRITPEELKSRLDSNRNVLVLDLRNQLDMNTDRFRIPGAFHALPEVLAGEISFPQAEEIILYCTCPHEATSARVAQQLLEKGVRRVRPLAGGFDAWRERGFPIEALD
jgi:membrane protein DedA with SNARE-associated domain/rhodanese-related sulfurtransferase